MSKTLKFNHKKIALFYTIVSLSVIIELLVFGMNTIGSFNESTANAKSKQQGISVSKRGDFAQNDILYYDPGECTISTKKGSISASGDFAKVMQAKNAEESVFDVDSSSPWYAGWGDGDEAGMKQLLENYGDLAYQLGDAAGAPWVAILVQMRYEDPSSCCGKNNFWGNGCDSSHSSYCGASTIQGENLGEGFVQYGETLSSDWYSPTRGIADPKEYLETIGPLWVQGDPNGAGYGSIDAMKDSVDALQAYIDSSEGQAIVSQFGNYSGSSSSSSSSGSDEKVSGNDITWIGDSYSVLAYNDYISKTFPGVDVGPSVGDESSYIQSNKSVSHDGGGPTCLDILEKIKDKGDLRKYLVFACGTNWGWEDEDITNFEDLLKDANTKAVVVTSKTPNSDYTESNERLKALADSNNNVYLADWTTVYDDSYFDDGIHPNIAPGYEKWVGVISDALSKINGGSCFSATYDGDYPEYLQCDPRWGSLPYDGETFCSAACGATAMAMITTKATGQEVLPTDVADLLGDLYYPENPGTAMEPLNKKVCEEYGCEVEMVPYTPGESGLADKLRQSLEDGWMILTSGGCNGGGSQNGHTSDTCPYSSGGHYVAIMGLKDNDTAIVGDPGWDGLTEYKLDVLAEGLKASAYSTIRGSGSSGSKCDSGNTCNDNGSSGTGTKTDQPIGPIHEDSSNIQCDPRTKDLGVRDDAYYNYERYSIRLCSIPNIRMIDTQGDDGDDGYVHVNSRVSGAFYALSEEHNKRCGNYLEAVDDYRTNAEQQALYDAYLNGTGNLAAVPGSPYSNHQQGLAIDFDTSTYCSSDSSVASGSGGWFESDFLAKFGLEDGRNFSQPENWHVQAMEQ